MSELSLEEYTDCPRTMEQCCNILRILYEHQVHRDMIYAASHLTAWHKVKGQGNKYHNIQARRDNNVKLFTREFDGLVEEYLVSRRGGIIFFPEFLPHHKGYSESFEEDRLQWLYPKDKDVIRGGVALFLENLMSHPYYFDSIFVKDAVLSNTFVSGDCEDCGSGECGENNDIVYCNHCKIGHHQECYGIFPIPLKHEPWFCSCCKDEGLAKARGPRPKANLKTSPSEDDARSVISSVAALRQKSTKRTSSLLSRENSAVESTKRSRLSLDGHPNAIDTNPSQATTRKSHSRRTSSIKSPIIATPTISQARKNSVQSPGFVPSSSLSRTSSADMSSSNFATPMQSVSRAVMMSPKPSALTTIDVKLAVRLVEEPVVRLIKYPAGSTVWDFFEACTEAWPAKFLPQVHRVLVRFDMIGGYLEIARPTVGADESTAEDDYGEFLELIKRIEQKPDEIIYIPVLALAKGEIAPGF